MAEKEAKPGSDAPFNLPRRVGNYEVVSKIGEGGMGSVYKARHAQLESFAAVKFLTPSLAQNDVFVKRFEREARLAAQLTSPFSIRTFDVGDVEGVRFILMEYVEGESLSKTLERRGKLPEKEAIPIILNVAQALQEAHEMGIIHRDIKPENIMINRRGVPKLADLGIAKQLTQTDQNLTMTGFAIGTPSFMSPEQAQGLVDVDTRSDIYSLGATLYRMVVGALPFNGPTPLSVMHRIATEPPPNPAKINPSLSPMMSNVICKMMATRREDRYQTIGEVVRQLESIRSGESASTTSVEQKQTTNIVSVAGINAAGGAPGTVSADAATNVGFLGSAKAAADRKRKIMIAAGIGGVVIVLGAIVGYVALNGGPKTPTTTVAVAPTTLEAPPATQPGATPQATQPAATTHTTTSAAVTQPRPTTTQPPAPATTVAVVTPPPTAPPPPTTTLPKPPTTTLPPNYTPLVTAVLANVKVPDWVGAVEAAEQLNRQSRNAAAHGKLLAAVKAGVQAADERGKARNLFQGKVSADFEAADERLGDAQKRLAAFDAAKIEAAPLDPVIADLTSARDGFAKVIKVEVEKATLTQKIALETASTLNAVRNGDWKTAAEAADRAANVSSNQPAQKKLKGIVASAVQASDARSKATQELSADDKAGEAFIAAEHKYRATLDKIGALDAAKLDAAQLDAPLAALNEIPGVYQKLVDDARERARQAAQLEREVRTKLAAVLNNVRDKDWVGATEAADQLARLSRNAPAHVKLVATIKTGGQAADEREKARKFFTGRPSADFDVVDARLADAQKRLAGLDATKFDGAPLDGLTNDLAAARDGFRKVIDVELAKANQVQRIALETATSLNGARNGDWRTAAEAADRALTYARNQPAQQKLKEVATAGTQAAAARAEATQATTPDARNGEAFTAAEARYRGILERLGGIDSAKVDVAQLDAALTGLNEMTATYRKLLEEAQKQAQAAVQSVRDLRAGLASAREGEWRAFTDSVARAISAGGGQPGLVKLRAAGEAGALTAAARAMAMRFSTDGKPLQGMVVPDTRYTDARERLGAVNTSKVDEAAVGKIIADLQECRDLFRKAADDAFAAAYPNLQKPIQGTNLVQGFRELYDARQRCADLPAVVDLASKYDPRGECLAIFGSMTRARAQAKDYASPEEASQARKALDDAVARCDRLGADPFYREKVAVLRRHVLLARAVASEAAGNPAGMLADAWTLQQAGEDSAAPLVARATQMFLDKMAAGIENDRPALLRMLELAGAELGSEALAPARKALTDAVTASKIAPRVFGDAALVRVWMQQIGPISPAGMVRVPPGTFALGEDYTGSVVLTPPSAPEHTVPVPLFYIDVTEVTNEQYQLFVDAGGYANDAWWGAAKGVDRAAFVDSTGKPGPLRWKDGRYPEGEGRMPVAGVSWYEAMAYAAWAGKALPTEAEWECAAVGAPPKAANGAYTDTNYPWGEEWVKGRAQVGTPRAAAVGSKPDDKSPVGCLDMTGNVREWTSSLFDRYPKSVARDRELGAGLIVVRGASYSETALSAMPVLRRSRAKETRDDRIGFRCVWIPPAPER